MSSASLSTSQDYKVEGDERGECLNDFMFCVAHSTHNNLRQHQQQQQVLGCDPTMFVSMAQQTN